MGPGLWEELRGMLFFSVLTHALILGLLGIFLYHYSLVKLPWTQKEYPVYSVNLVNFTGAFLTTQPGLTSGLSGLSENPRVSSFLPVLKPIFKKPSSTSIGRTKGLPVISGEPVKPPAVSKRITYPTLLTPAKGGKARRDIIASHLLSSPNLTKPIARTAVNGLDVGEDQPVIPTQTLSTNMIPKVGIEPLERAPLALGKQHINLPEFLQVKAYTTPERNPRLRQRSASLLITEALSPPEIYHPIVPSAPAPTPFAPGGMGNDPSFMKGGFTSLNTQDPNLIPYVSQIKERVLDLWRYPMEAKSGLRGTVQLAFTVERDGSVSRIELLKSSGYPVLDKGAIQALSRASPFSPLPQEIKVTSLSIAGTFNYNME